jgi:PTS system ascorbate-specific IIC component
MFVLDMFATPTICIGMFACVSLLLQRKGVADIVAGTIKTVMGFFILLLGAAALSETLYYFRQLFLTAFSIQGTIPNNEAIVSIAQPTFAVQTVAIMVLGMVVNLLLARYTRFPYIFLTGHHIFFMACMLTVILTVAGIKGVSLVIIGAMSLGLMMVLMPALLQPMVNKITDSNDFAIGHFGSIGYFVAGTVGRAVGNLQKSTEEINVPKGFGFLRDTSVATLLMMIFVFFILSIAAGKTYIESELSDGQPYLLFALVQAILFAAGIYIVLAGIRLLIAEVVPAFQGIAKKVVPHAILAIDCTTVFPFAPNAVILGFIASFVAGILCMLILPLFGLSVIIPGLIPHFFTGATAGVFGNATGGWRGAVFGAFANGLIISLLPALLIPFLGSVGLHGVTFGDADFAVIGIIIGYLVQIQPILVYVLPFGIIAFLLVHGWLKNRKQEIGKTKRYP